MHYELYEESQMLLFSWFGNTYPIMTENADFTPPTDGSPYLKFDYIEAQTETVSLDRKCRVFIGMVQVSVIFSPGVGIALPRKIAEDVAKRAIDGIMLSDTSKCYISEAGSVHSVQKSNSGWVIPVRFYVRAESHTQ